MAKIEATESPQRARNGTYFVLATICMLPYFLVFGLAVAAMLTKKAIFARAAVASAFFYRFSFSPP